MGRPKGLLEAGNKFWLFCQLDAYRKAGGKCAAVILGYDADRYASVLPLPGKETERGSLHLSVLINPLPQFGPFSSVQTGCSFFLNKGASNVFFAAVDRPLPPPEIWRELAAANVSMAFPEYNGKQGHPVFLSKKFAESLLSMPPEKTRMDVLRDALAADARRHVSTDFEMAGKNLNTPEEWSALSERLAQTYARPEIFMQCGEKRSGKTSKIRRMIGELKAAGIKTGGIIQPSFGSAHDPDGYEALDVETGETRILARKKAFPQAGERFEFNEATWAWANEKILNARKTADVLIVDEIGRLEAEGRGHLPALTAEVGNESALFWILSTRKDAADAVCPRLSFAKPVLI